MSHNKNVHSHIREVVDAETGELVDDYKYNIDVLVKDEEEFYFAFSRHFAAILKLNAPDMKVVTWCAMNISMNTNEVALGIAQKRKIAKLADLAIGTIDNSISSLVKNGFLIRVDTGLYKVHPEVFWRGHIKMRNRQLSLSVTYKVATPEQVASQNEEKREKTQKSREMHT